MLTATEQLTQKVILLSGILTQYACIRLLLFPKDISEFPVGTKFE
jgi:hypothetical protein